MKKDFWTAVGFGILTTCGLASCSAPSTEFELTSYKIRTPAFECVDAECLVVFNEDVPLVYVDVITEAFESWAAATGRLAFEYQIGGRGDFLVRMRDCTLPRSGSCASAGRYSVDDDLDVSRELGVALHEVGHVLDLPHAPGGLMHDTWPVPACVDATAIDLFRERYGATGTERANCD